MIVSLRRADLGDAELIHQMQIAAFAPLLEKYQDYEYSPAMETLERTVYRMSLPVADHWLILLGSHPIGAIGIGRYEGVLKLKRLFILPEYQNQGFASELVAKVCYETAVRGHKIYLFYLDPVAGHVYRKVGFRELAVWTVYNLEE